MVSRTKGERVAEFEAIARVSDVRVRTAQRSVAVAEAVGREHVTLAGAGGAGRFEFHGVDRPRRCGVGVLDRAPARGEGAVCWIRVGCVREEPRRASEAVREACRDVEPIFVVDRVIEFHDHAVGLVGFGVHGEVVISEERSRVRVRLRQQGDRGLGHGIEPRWRNRIAGEWIPQVLKVFGGDRLGRIVRRVEAGAGRVEDRQRRTVRVDGGAEIACPFGAGRDRAEVGTRDALTDAFIGDGEERLATAIVEAGDDDGSGDVESELIAPQEILIRIALAQFVGGGVEEIVAEVLEQPAMEARLGALVAAERGLSARRPSASVCSLNSWRARWMSVRRGAAGAAFACAGLGLDWAVTGGRPSVRRLWSR
jgi:hypothetical protein